MINECVYTTIEYYPKSFNDESINVAFVFHNATQGKLFFIRAKNKKRVMSFDDEMTANEYDMIMDTFEITLFNQTNNIVFDSNYLKSLNNFFLNEFKFSKISKINSENVEQDMNDLLKLVLYYDFEKKDRLKPDVIEKILKRNIYQQLSYKNMEFDVDYLVNDFGYGEQIKVDFKIGDTYIKILNLKANAYTLKINTAKTWAFNKSYFDKKNKKLVFAITTEPVTDPEKTYIDILRSTNAEIYYMDQIMDILN